MSSPSKAVDVIGTIRRHAESHRAMAECDAYSAQEAPRLEAALAAVAELIEADREYDEAHVDDMDCPSGEDVARFRRAGRRRAAALAALQANCGEA